MKPSLILDRLKGQAKDDASVRALTVLVEKIFDECTDVMKTTIRTMPEYTLHDEVHLERMVELMGRLIPRETLERLKPLELASLLLGVALHDIGMSPSRKELNQLFKKPNRTSSQLDIFNICGSVV
jgi:molecular chaperone HtpG